MTNGQRLKIKKAAELAGESEVGRMLREVLADEHAQEFDRKLADTIHEFDIMKRMYFGEGLEAASQPAWIRADRNSSEVRP